MESPENTQPIGTRRTTRRWVAFGMILIGGILFSIYFHRPLFRGNLDIVEPGQVLRSAQPVGDVLGLIRSQKLGSVVNLRGGKPTDPWYSTEVEATEAAGVEFYDLPMSAVRRPSRHDLLVLIDLLDRCKYPLLIHCKSGSDRTGLGVVLYRLYRKGEPPAKAMEGFSLAHGHVPLLGPEHLHEPINEYAAWLEKGHLDHTPARFVDWLKHEYRSDDALVAIDPVRPGPRIRR